MIPYFLMIILQGLIGGILSPLLLVPDVSLDPSIAVSFATAGRYFGLIWSTAPATFVSLFAIMALVVGIETNLFSYKTIRWLYSKIPGVN